MFRPARWHRSTAGTDPERPIVPHPLRAAAAIVGAVDAVSPDGRLGRSDAQLEVEVIRGALEDASLTIADVHCLMQPHGMMGSLELRARPRPPGRVPAPPPTAP